MSRKPHQPTDVSRALVATLASYGIPQTEICKHPQIKCSDETLRKHYREELDEGRAEGLHDIGKALHAKAMKGDTAALIFLAKTRMGFREVSRVETTGADGGPIRVEESPRERIERRIARLAVVGGTESGS